MHRAGQICALLVLLAPSRMAQGGHGYHDGHARPRAILHNPADGLLYVALSTADSVVVIDPGEASRSAGAARLRRPPKVLTSVRSGPFPQALAVLSDGTVLVSCRFDPALGMVRRVPGGDQPSLRYERLPSGAEHGHRGLAVNEAARVVYLASPPARGVKVVSLDGRGVLQTLPTGISPRTLRLIDDPRHPGRHLLLVANFLGRTVTAHEVRADGRLAPALQTLSTAAPVHDLIVLPTPQPELLMLTHEDRDVDRKDGPVTGLDSVALSLPLGREPGGAPFIDAGPGQRRSFNLCERRGDLLAKLDAVAFDPPSGRLAIVGAATDNLLVTRLPQQRLPAGAAVKVGTSPVAVAFLPDGRLATADRLSDTVSLIDGGAVTQVVVGRPERESAEGLGELLFYGRALVPNNIADGPLSVYACSACHDDGHVDGRLHPARKNRFYSVTRTCRSLATTAPYLSLGSIADLDAFADNIVATHAQGAERHPDTYDRYEVSLRVFRQGRFTRVTLSPTSVRKAMAAYLRVIPSEPSPHVPPEARLLSAPARAGLALFRARCSMCHMLVRDTTRDESIPDGELEARILQGEVALTSAGRYDVGVKVLGEGGNNPPSLRGVWDAAPYLSDGSTASLEELLRRTDPSARRVHAQENARAAPRMSEEERAALLAFLRSL